MSTKLTREEKIRIANKINYFRTMPYEIRKSAGNLEAAGRVTSFEYVNHENKAVVVNGRVMILNVS